MLSLRTTKRWFFATLFILPAWLILHGCGGGGGGLPGGGSGGGGGNAVMAPLTLKAQFPAGYSGNASAMTVSGGMFADTPLSGGSATVNTWTNARQFVAVLGPTGVPVLMGFVGPGHSTLNSRTTADALVYIAIAGYLAPTENQRLLIEAIEQKMEGNALATAIASDLKTHPTGLDSPTATYRAALSALAKSYMGGAPGKMKRILTRAGKVAIDPYPSAKSGVTVDYGSDVKQILAHNTFRRRALMFIDRTSDVDTNGNETPDFQHMQTVEITPARGTVYGNDLFGNLGNALQQTDAGPYTLPDCPPSFSKVKYTVAVAGPGTSAGDNYVLSTSEQAELKKELKKAFFVDMLLPALARILVQNTLDKISIQQQKLLMDEMTDNATAQESAIASFVDQYFPQVEPMIEAGDFKGALNACMVGIWNSDSTTTAVANFFASFMGQLPDFPGKPDGSHFGKMLSWLNKALSVNSASAAVYGLIDQLPQGRDYVNSAKMQSWSVAVDLAKLTFTPQNSTINASGNNTFVKLTANVSNLTLQTGQKLTYKFATPGAHGSLSLNGGGGQNSIQTDQNFIIYSSGVGLQATYGTDPVSVEVFLDHGGGNLEKIGAAKVTVKVEAQSDITLIPTPISVHPNESTPSIVAKTHYPDLLSSGELQLKWSVKGKLGTINLDSTPTSQNSVVFTAGGTEGTETVQCDIVEAATGKTLSTATATVKIEKKTSIVFGSIYFSGWQSYSGGWCTGGSSIGVKIPKVSGATSYSVHCYNFNDTAYWGTSFDAGCDAAGNGSSVDITPDGTPGTTHGAYGVFYFGLTGGAGFGPGPCSGDPMAGLDEYANQRFGGMIVQVTVTY